LPANVAVMLLTYCYRLLPRKAQHRALEAILEGQRQLYNAALEERIGAFRNAGVTRTFFDQCKALTEWRRSDAEAAGIPVCLQRWTLKQLDEAYRGFFRRVKAGGKPGFPRFRGKGRFDSFGFREFSGIRLERGRLRFPGMPGALRVHLHRALPEGAPIRCCVFRRDVKGWKVGFVVDVPAAPQQPGDRAVGVDLGISTFAALSDGGIIPSLRAGRRAERKLRQANRALAEAACAGTRLMEVDPHDTSQDCSGCGVRVPKVLGDRLHECAHCGLVIDRDLNAARNILHRAGVGPGLLNVAGYGMRAGGNLVGAAFPTVHDLTSHYTRRRATCRRKTRSAGARCR
jgi:transposase